MSGLKERYASVVEIGRIPISVSTDNLAFSEVVRRCYANFLSASQPEFELDIKLGDPGTVLSDDVRLWREESEWLIERGDFRVRWNPTTGRGLVAQNPHAYSLESALRILHSLAVAERGGFLLHAASAICDGRAYLFSGVSGAGKTTVSRLAPPDVTLLTDEISYIRPSLGGYEAFGTPFAGELSKAGGNCSAPIDALFFLQKGPGNAVEELAPSEAVLRLMRNILFFAEDPVLAEKLFESSCDFIRQVPTRQLTFYPDSRVWDAVRQFQGEPANV